jgi:hypothetical protein
VTFLDLDMQICREKKNMTVTFTSYPAMERSTIFDEVIEGWIELRPMTHLSLGLAKAAINPSI